MSYMLASIDLGKITSFETTQLFERKFEIEIEQIKESYTSTILPYIELFTEELLNFMKEKDLIARWRIVLP